VRREHVAIEYKGKAEGVHLLVDLLRMRGLKVSHSFLLNFPLQDQQRMIHRDIVEVYGTRLEVKGGSDVRAAAQAAIDDFERRWDAAAEISLEQLGSASGPTR
jgi:hypothetical protein